MSRFKMIDGPPNQEPDRTIRVWLWEHAPKEYQELSTHGGDEDYVAHVPAAITDAYLPWLEDGSAFGRCSVSEHHLPDGSKVYIGAHA